MRTTKIYNWAILLLIILVSFNSCNNDDDMLLLTQTTNTGNGDPTEGTQTGSQGEITLYKVNAEVIDRITNYKVSGQDLVYQNDVAKHQELWSLTKKIVPLDHRTKMSEFMIYNGNVTGSAGYVVETKNDLSQWQMGLAINFADDQRELVYTIIHEFGHILTLNNTQVNANIPSESCANFFTGEGCSRDNSYINKLHKLYWADIWSEYQQAQNSETAHQAFYEKHRDRFVTNYAATNPGEDIAEVFATFVTRSDKPSGTTIAGKKILLMYDYPELVQLRNYIRSSSNLSGRGVDSFLPKPGSWKQATTLGNSKHSHCGKNHKS
tara:strand:- start:2715 stop:3683 length:969 start_codon:yes stop_codon:yes gene_type:complete